MRVSGLLVMRGPRIVRGFRQIGARVEAVLLLLLAALELMEVVIVLSMLVSVEMAALVGMAATVAVVAAIIQVGAVVAIIMVASAVMEVVAIAVVRTGHPSLSGVGAAADTSLRHPASEIAHARMQLLKSA